VYANYWLYARRTSENGDFDESERNVVVGDALIEILGRCRGRGLRTLRGTWHGNGPVIIARAL
jgi:hypothetical protein